MKSRILAVILSLLLVFACTGTGLAAEVETEASELSLQALSATEKAEKDPVVKGKVIEVSLQKGSSRARSNYNKLSSALKKGGGSTSIIVKIKKPGSYHVHSGGGGALMLRSNTTLDLNGSELIRSGRMTNLLQDCSKRGKRTARGYGLASHITVKNGTLNGSGGTHAELNLVNIGHASNLLFSNVNFRNCRGGHLLELSGCRNCVIEKCTFSGHKGSKTSEAIQLDISNGKVGWNGVYAKGSGNDCTPCKNITVRNCSFKNYPSGVGNHHTVKGRHNSNIKIVNNTFTNRSSSKAPAIWCYGFNNSEVSGNTITGKYEYGIRVSGGSVRVKSNTIGSSSKKVGYQAVFVVRASSHLRGSHSRTPEKVTGGVVDGNTIYSGYHGSPILVTSGSRLSSASNNEVHTGKKTVLSVSGGAQVSQKTGNIRI